MDAVYKVYRAEVRGIDEDEGTVDMFIPVSTDSIDRDGEVVEPLAFKKTLPKFMKRPVLVASHDYRDLTNQIGEWSKLKIGDTGIDGKPKYYINEGNEQADWGFKLASKGMAAFSIGFIPKVWVDGDGVKEPRRTYKEVELLEISQVIVPSNREAIQGIRSKGVDPITDKLYEDILNDKDLITKPEETDEYIRIPVDTGDHEGHRIRTIDISEKEGIKAIYCGTDKVVMTYLFSKDEKYGWTMSKAREWVKEHEGKTLHPAGVSQAEIMDELDYIIRLIDTEGMNDDVKRDAWNLVREMLRLAGDDIPEDIKGRFTVEIIKYLPAEINPITGQDISEAIKRIVKT